MSSRYRLGLSSITFVVDTGSTDTIISPADAFRLHLPINSLKNQEEEPYVVIGGNKFKRKKAVGITLMFRDDKGNAKQFIYDPTIIESTKQDQDSLKLAYSLPSLLGVDFLLKNKLSLHFIPHKETVYLESEDV